MTLERGLRRIVLVVSAAVFIGGLVFIVSLVGAWAWSLQLDRERDQVLKTEDCPADREPRPTELTLKAVASGRWRVTVPKGDYTATYVVAAQREIRPEEIIKAIEAPPTSADLSFARRRPAPSIEVIDCIFRSVEIAAWQEQTSLGIQAMTWWLRQPGAVLSVEWGALRMLNKHPSLVWLTMLTPALVLIGVGTVLPWGLFFLIRGIAHRIAVGKDR